MPDGTPHQPWSRAERLPNLLSRKLECQRRRQSVDLASVTGFNHPTAGTIRPGWAGDRFQLHDCVQALFAIQGAAAEEEAA